MGTHNRVRLKNSVFKGVVGSTDISTRSVASCLYQNTDEAGIGLSLVFRFLRGLQSPTESTVCHFRCNPQAT